MMPEAEFARASGRGLRRIRNFIQDAKEMCKKTFPARLAQRASVLPKELFACIPVHMLASRQFSSSGSVTLHSHYALVIAGKGVRNASSSDVVACLDYHMERF
jgi:hypothetical protein